MSERSADESTNQHHAVKRRGILAAAGAVVAGIAMKQMAQPVGAINGGSTGGTLIIGANSADPGGTDNTANRATRLINTYVTPISSISYYVGDAFVAAGSGGGTGVTGISNGSGTGVYGAVYSGNSNSSGVYGTSANGKGVSGYAGTGGIGVLGQSDSTTSIGVQGQSTSGVGVFGVSNGNAGVLGISNAPGNVGIGGIANISGTAAFAGTSTNPNAFAGFFTGDVFVNGNFTVNDPTRKHGAIQHPDGSLRLLYSMESPESWLEDFGTGQLVSGRADERLDPDFAAVTQADGYLVFLTPRDAGCKGLAVVAQTAGGFVVQELNGGTSSGAFNYRVVAKPKSEHKAARLAKFTVPEIKVPTVPVMAQTAIPSTPSAPPSSAPPPDLPPSRANPPAAVPPQGSGATPSSPANPVQPAPPPRP
jgi:hypothetical protein